MPKQESACIPISESCTSACLHAFVFACIVSPPVCLAYRSNHLPIHPSVCLIPVDSLTLFLTAVVLSIQVAYDTQVGLWSYSRLRVDKTEPNIIGTVMGVLTEQAEEISIEELEYRYSNPQRHYLIVYAIIKLVRPVPLIISYNKARSSGTTHIV